MIVTVNGDEQSLADGTTVDALVSALGLTADGRGVAVAVDTQVVPRSEWDTTELPPGARVEVVAAVQGG